MSKIIREPCLCCECKYWLPYIIDNRELGLDVLNWGMCLKDKPAFPDMEKCEEFVLGRY